MVSAKGLSLFGLLMCFGTALGQTCKDGWIRNGGLCYGYINTPLSWPEAQAFCYSLGGTKLAEPRSAAENRFLKDIAVNRRAAEGVWIGGTNAGPDGSWRWASTGQVIYPTYWNKGEPNGRRGNEHCLHIWRNIATWNDRSCRDALNFVCEYRP